jgi:hypothetical protein
MLRKLIRCENGWWRGEADSKSWSFGCFSLGKVYPSASKEKLIILKIWDNVWDINIINGIIW